MTSYHIVQPLLTATERLLAVADLLERRPELLMQSQWAQASGTPGQIAQMHTCGTSGCIAGWGVAMTPEELLENRSSWTSAGRIAYGLDDMLANAIFSADFQPTEGVPAALRALARLPENERTFNNAVKRITLVGIALSGVERAEADFEYAVLGRSGLRKSKWTKCRMRGVVFVEARLGQAKFVECDLSEADFRDADVRYVTFGGSTLCKANFRDAIAWGCNFKRTNAQGASFQKALLDDSKFASANLTNADFSRSGLVGVSFARADLTGADFTAANLTNADFTGAILTGAIINIPAAKAVGATFQGVTL